jgi:16S rRNA processing protein RimM
MKIESCYKVGVVAKPHGLKGEVTVILNDAPADWDALKTIFLLEKGNRLVPYFIDQISVRGTKAFVKFEDIDSPEAAEAISKHEIFLPKTERPKAAKGDFYDDEVIGFEVTDETHGELGTVDSVETSGPNRLLVVIKNEKEILIPINSPFIKTINKSKQKISVDLPEGFLDI